MRSCFCFAPPQSKRGSKNGGATQIANSQDESKHPAADAVRAGRLAVTFSGGGFLLPYFIGVADQLLRLGILRPGGATPLAGSSSGSLIASALACGLSPTQIHDSFLHTVADCRAHGSEHRLERVVRAQLEATLPPDAAERCSGVVTVGVTCLFPKPRTWHVSSFESREDLIAALMASCHIPRYFNGKFARRFRGRVAVDGGATALLPVPNAPHDFLLKVCCFPRVQVARLPVLNRDRALKHLALGITPDAFGPWPHGFRDMLAAALHPREDAFLENLVASGRRDAAAWAESAGLAPRGTPRTPLSSLAPLALSSTAAAAASEDQFETGLGLKKDMQHSASEPALGKVLDVLGGGDGTGTEVTVETDVGAADVEEGDDGAVIAGHDRGLLVPELEGGLPAAEEADTVPSGGSAGAAAPVRVPEVVTVPSRLTGATTVSRTVTEQSYGSLPTLSPCSTRGRSELGEGTPRKVGKDAGVGAALRPAGPRGEGTSGLREVQLLGVCDGQEGTGKVDQEGIAAGFELVAGA